MASAPEIPTITLLTDFGTRDQYVGVMKGVIAGICPRARVVDISHEVEPYQIAQGMYLLEQSWRWFPQGTVHVAVVDPGVGSARRPLAAELDGHLFVLPDNGLLAHANAVRRIENAAWCRHPVSRTFHGRDIFAPAAAHLANGEVFEEAGPLVTDWVRLPASAGISVLHIDRFGNIVTSLRANDYRDGSVLEIGGHRVAAGLARSYRDAPVGKLFLIEGSGGYVEVSVRENSAAERIGCRVGDLTEVKRPD